MRSLNCEGWLPSISAVPAGAVLPPAQRSRRIPLDQGLQRQRSGLEAVRIEHAAVQAVRWGDVGPGIQPPLVVLPAHRAWRRMLLPVLIHS